MVVDIENCEFYKYFKISIEFTDFFNLSKGTVSVTRGIKY